jgi:two-component system nitrate/nitrite response regulator NarL
MTSHKNWPTSIETKITAIPSQARTPCAVWLIDAQPLLRTGLRTHLSVSGFEVAAEGASLDEACEARKNTMSPDLIILDYAQGTETVRQVASAHPTARLVVLAEKVSLPELSAAFSAGAHGYLLKSISANALVESLRLALAGEKIFPSQMTAVLESLSAGTSAHATSAPKIGGVQLSHQEFEVTRRLAEGFANKSIAMELSITEATVKVHVKSLMRKIGVINRTQAAIWAIQNGLTMAPKIEALGMKVI